MRSRDIKSALIIVGHLPLYHRGVYIAALPCPRRRRNPVGQRIDDPETGLKSGRRIEKIFVRYFRFGLIRIEKNGVAVFPAIPKVFDHAPERRHADAAGDEDKLLFFVVRKCEVARDASREHRASRREGRKRLFEVARTVIELHTQPHVGLRRRRCERKIPAVTSGIGFLRRERPFCVLTGRKLRRPSGKYEFIGARCDFSDFFQLQDSLEFRADEVRKYVAGNKGELRREIYRKYVNGRGEKEPDQSAIEDAACAARRRRLRLGEHDERKEKE